ncbi:MAG: SpoIIIAH-like family protein [Clostridia bacterium]|nr:SpoIIIAH-like family protein [Clostridia bacterium]
MSIKFTVVNKNQLLAGTITLMLVTAGYLNYKYDPNKTYDVEVTSMIEENLGDAVLVDANGIIKDFDNAGDFNYTVSTDGTTPVFQNNSNQEPLEGTEKVFNEIEDYFISTRIDRTNNYASQIESYENILNSNNIGQEQKNRAQEEIERINKIRNSIMIAENLIKLKGFDETIVLVNEDSINVIVAADSLNNVEIAQLQSIIINEFSVDIGKVHIINYE